MDDLCPRCGTEQWLERDIIGADLVCISGHRIPLLPASLIAEREVEIRKHYGPHNAGGNRTAGVSPQNRRPEVSGVIMHGTVKGYYSQQCRCDDCRAAMRVYNREIEARRRAANEAE